jgi:hypothetical protein
MVSASEVSDFANGSWAWAWKPCYDYLSRTPVRALILDVGFLLDRGSKAWAGYTRPICWVHGERRARDASLRLLSVEGHSVASRPPFTQTTSVGLSPPLRSCAPNGAPPTQVAGFRYGARHTHMRLRVAPPGGRRRLSNEIEMPRRWPNARRPSRAACPCGTTATTVHSPVRG